MRITTFADASAANANVMESDLRTPRGRDDDTDVSDLRTPRGRDDDTDVLQVRDNPPLCIYLNIFSAADCNLRKFSAYD